ncbi:MAG: XdhC family protein [Anaerolineales bacterium]|nr:MAG: XdhC family protein [Anaerolineales bacterium]
MEENEAVYEAILEALRGSEAACVLTVIEAEGSTPREVGAKMLLRADGSTVGTIGGGAMEASAVTDAKEALRSKQSRVTEYSLRGEGEGELGVCGGAAKVFIEVLQLKPTLLIAGGGHVAEPLAELGQMLGFRTVVVDDRPEFANRERFPHADRLVVAPFDALLSETEITAHTYVVIVTRGHQYDSIVLRQVLTRPAAYVGMIGSRRKVRTVFERLLSEGVPREKLAEVYTPIGLRTQGQTPVEIALSIMAEIVLVQHGGSGEPLSWRDNPLREGSH